MHARLIATLVLLLAGTWAASCSSGLGRDPRGGNAPSAAAASNPNLPLGLDLGFVPTSPVAEPAIAGVVVPAIGATAAREIVFLAFSTAARSDNGDGAGTPLARDTTTDGNGASDVFVAAISAQDVERRAFSQSLAGKFRHPRCATCHMMQAADTTAFVSSAQPHAGPPPGPGFPNNDPATCAPCHVTSNTFPVVGWMAPAASFDMRPKTVAQLAQMAQNVPADDLEHFVTDRRVLWALDSGILPAVGGRNGRADDDHDGVLEPEDSDGTPRTVPGGSVAFLHEIEQWRASGMVVSTAAAVRDVTLVSRQSGTTAAANGASSAPRLKWVPNASFDPNNAAATNPIGTLFVAFQSTASNLTAGDANGASDVFRAAVELRAEENATGAATVRGLNLVTLDSTVLCSAPSASATAANGGSTRPSIGGANAEFVAFESVATNLVAGFTNGNGAGADVYLRTIGASTPGSTTQLVSHLPGQATMGGNGASERASIAADGSAVAFESDAADLVNGDGNGLRDVFFAGTAGSAPFTLGRASVTGTGLEGTGGDCRSASVHSAGGRIRVAFESDKTDLAAGLAAATNVFLFDSNTGTTQLLNRRVSPGVTASGDGAAGAPVFFPNGAAIAFQSDASNLDVLRADTNGTTDVFVVETEQLDAGRVLPFRVSMTAAEAASGNGASTAPVVGAFTNSANFQTGFVAYRTQATNLGTSDTTDVMVSFLDETSGILVDFSASPTTGIAPLQVQFTDASTGSPTGWEWDFDNDGTIDSTQQNPRHTYTTPGDFTVKLTVRNSNTTADKTSVAFVHVTGSTQADFTTAPTTSGGAPLTVLFTDTSTQANGSLTAWAWDFDGDGTTDSTVQNPAHTYTTPGTFTVRLTTTGENGSSATVTRTGLVTVTAPGSLVASFTSTVSASPLGGRVGTAVGSVYSDETVQFTASPNGAASYFWNFGDGTTSTTQNPTHSFTTPGTYSVFLTVGDGTTTDSEVKPALITAVEGASTVVLEPSQDNTIYETLEAGPPIVNLRNNNYGAGADMVAGNTISRGPRRALLRFDVSGLPASAVIQSASLQLTNTSPSTVGQVTGTQTFAIRRVTSSWVEGTTATGAAGQGGPAQGGGSTWLRRSTSPVVSWSTAGGDFAGGAATGTIQVTDALQAFTSTNVGADVQTWLTTPASNFGWILIGNEAATKTVKWFATRENTTASARPKLTVVFRPPLP